MLAIEENDPTAPYIDTTDRLWLFLAPTGGLRGRLLCSLGRHDPGKHTPRRGQTWDCRRCGLRVGSEDPY